MIRRRAGRGLCFPALLAVIFLVGLAPPLPGESQPQAPTLLVVLVADGLSGWSLDSARPVFSSGLRRLLDEGWVSSECRYRHVPTDTGPGHASIATGAPPAVHGIVGNEWLQPRKNGALEEVYCASQPSAADPSKLVPGAGRLRVPSIADRLLDRHRGSRVIALSGKDRGAVFLAGRSGKGHAYWLDTGSGRFVTSNAAAGQGEAAGAIPSLVDRFNAEHSGATLAKKRGPLWERLPLPSAPAAERRVRDAEALGEKLAPHQRQKVGKSFPHDLSRHVEGLYKGWLTSPVADELLADLALALLRDETLGLGRDEQPDLLAISFSSHDYVAHAYGPESLEALEVLRSLDRAVGRLLDALDRVAPGRVVVGLGSDHGFEPLLGMRGRLGARSVVERLNRAIAKSLCLPTGRRPLSVLAGPYLYADPEVLPLLVAGEGCNNAGWKVAIDEVWAAVAQAVPRVLPEHVESVRTRLSATSSPPSLPFDEFARNSFDPERSGGAILFPRRGVVFDGGGGRGASHGSHHDGDAHVPLLFWGAGVPARTSSEPATPYDLAPTLAARIGLTLPQAVGRDRLARH